MDGYFASRQLALRARGRCLVSLLHAGEALLFFRKGLLALLCELLNLRTLLVTTFPILRKTYSECFEVRVLRGLVIQVRLKLLDQRLQKLLCKGAAETITKLAEKASTELLIQFPESLRNHPCL